MKIVYINTFNHGSTGRICTSLASFMKEKGNEVYCFYGREEDNSIPGWKFIGEDKLSILLNYYTGKIGSYHKINTKRLIKRLEEIKPDVIHLHNIHGNYLNFDLLFDYLSKSDAKIIFTLHDEFLATGRCAYIPANCDRRAHQCDHCQFLEDYPRAKVDRAHSLFLKKIQYLDSLKNVTFVSPSKWLQNSFLSSDIGRGRNCVVINNGFDLSKIERKEIKRENNKIRLFAAAFEWNELKGRHILAELSQKLDLNKYELIVAGGIQDNYKFPAEIQYFPKMSKEKLAELYLSSDIFLMPTFNDNFPTVLIESLSYGLPIISFNSGGCSEIFDSSTGVVTKERTADSLLEEINKFDFKKFSKENCYKRAKEFSFDKFLNKYYDLYK